MTWQKITGMDVNEGGEVGLLGVMTLKLTLENKDGETYETEIAGSDARGKNLGPTEVYEAVEDADEPWADMDFQDKPRRAYVAEVSDGEPF